MTSEIEFTLDAQTRQDVGKGASRRLRRDKKVPAVVYGGGQDTQALTLSHDEVWRKLQTEAFFSRVVTLNVDGKKKQQAIVRDLQRHPYKSRIAHMDFQRVVADQELQVRVPLHFVNEDVSEGVRMHGGEMSHLETEVLVACLPKDLPEYIEVDCSGIDLGDTLHLSDVVPPAGVRLVDLDYGEEYDRTIVSCHMPRVTAIEEAAELEAEAEAAAEAGAEGIEAAEAAEAEEGTAGEEAEGERESTAESESGADEDQG